MPADEISLRRIQRLARAGRSVCSVILVFAAIVLSLVLIGVMTAPLYSAAIRLDLGPAVVTSPQLIGVSLKVWVSIVMLAGGTVVVGALLRLRAVFVNLAAGEIYSTRNVSHIRAVGLFVLAGACMQLVIWLLSLLLLSTRIIDWSEVTRDQAPLSLNGLVLFLEGGLIVLVAWIMDVGRKATEEVATLREDAELVI